MRSLRGSADERQTYGELKMVWLVFYQICVNAVCGDWLPVPNAAYKTEVECRGALLTVMRADQFYRLKCVKPG